jgi:anti-anti-sigma regulatory factor
MWVVKAGEARGADGVVVHDLALKDPKILEEAFLNEGKGSAFLSRPNEIVVIKASADGLPALPNKVEQLVSKGFHNIVVSLSKIPALDQNTLKVLMKSKQYLDNWAGSLRICEVEPGVLGVIKILGFDSEIEVLTTRDEAVARVKAALAGADSGNGGPGSAGPGSTQQLATASSDLMTSSGDDSEDRAGHTMVMDVPEMPPVDVAEFVVTQDELPQLEKQIQSSLGRGKKYVTMRLSFKKRMRSEDVDRLVAARNQVKAAGGQLVLASLQADVLQWLKLLEFDREFLIFEDADAAEVAHRKHAMGQSVAPAGAAPAPKEAPSGATFEMTERTRDRIVVRPKSAVGKGGVARTKVDVPVLELAREALPGLQAEVARRVAAGSKDVIVDVGALDQVRGERVEPLSEAVEAARAKGGRVAYARVGRELRAFLKIMGLEAKLGLHDDVQAAGFALATDRYKVQPFEELEERFVREKVAKADAPAAGLSSSSITFESSASESRAPTEVVEVPGVQAVQELQTQLDKAKAELAQRDEAKRKAESKATELESLRKTAEKRATDAEAQRDQAKRRTAEVETLAKSIEAELEQAKKGASAQAQADAGAKAKATDLEKKLAAAEKARSEVEKKATSLEAKSESLDRKVAELEAKASAGAALEKKLKESEQKVKVLEQKAASSSSKSDDKPSGKSDDKRVQQLEREKAEILVESQREIERLAKEQEVLREELESAGEMIERLGKELELS